jgi:uncharacterized protein YbcI
VSEPGTGPDALRQIERAVVGIYKRDLGRGPKGIRVSWFADECGVVVTLAGFYTQGEENLIKSGRFEAVEAGRSALQRTIAADLRAAVEEIAQRRVIAVLGQVNDDPPLGCVVFLFEAPT